MAPYDVLVDPDSLPKHPVLEKSADDDDTHSQHVRTICLYTVAIIS